MAVVSVEEAAKSLPGLIERAAGGEEIVLSADGVEVAHLVAPDRAPAPRKPWALKGKIWMAPDFDETSREIIDAFKGVEAAR